MNTSAMISDVAMSFGLLAVVALFGLPTYAAVARSAGLDRPSLGLCWLFGFFWLSVASWYAFAAGIKLGDAYRVVVVLSVALVGLGFALPSLRRAWLRPGRARWASGQVGADLAGFGVGSVCYVALAVSRLTPGDLQWPTVKNADVFVYAKLATHLAHFPGGRPTVGTGDLRDFIATDVFGCFNLLSFAKFVFRSEVSHVVVPVMALAAGLVGMAVARSCRVVFRIGVPLSTLLATLTVTGVLFQYVVLNYFLSQATFTAIMLTAVLWVVERHGERWRQLTGYGLVAFASSACVLLTYNVWSLQFVTLLAAAVAVTRGAAPGLSIPRRVGTGALSFAAIALVGLAGMACASPSRLAHVANQLATVSVPNIAGWPLPFVDLDLLLGLPIDWQVDAPSKAAVYGPALGFLVLLVAVGSSAARFDRAVHGGARLITLGIFCAGVLAYLAVWSLFGETYQQWKFASTIPLGFGFAVLATIIGLALRDTAKLARAAMGAAAAAVLVACIGLNVVLTRDKWLATISHLPVSLESLASADQMPGQTPFYLDIADFQTRMAALAFIDLKPVTFAAGTAFGPGVAPPADGPYLHVTTACDPAGLKPQTVVAELTDAGRRPVVPLDQPILLSHDVSGCLSMSGFAAPEPWGSRSVGRHAAFHLRCACDLASDHVSLVLDAASPLLPDLPAPQRAVIEVNGSAPRSYDLDPARFSDIVVPVPPPPGGGSAVDVEIDLPDAAARPAAAASPDAPTYALSLKSLTLRAGTP